MLNKFARSLLLAFVALSAPSLARAQDADVIRGRVVGPDSVPIEGATVTATSISGNVSRAARTDRSGRYTITFPGGDGDYMVAFAALGFGARRFEVKRVADEDFLVADARLARVATVLDVVEVTAPRERVGRNDPTPDVSGSERQVDNAGLPAADMGDLAAMAASLPGVQLATGEDGSSGYSVLGLGADQNQTTLNGMPFGGSSLPRDVTVISSLVTSPYDVSRGGFSGAQFNIRSRPGSNFQVRGMSANLDSPHLQWTDAAARALGQEYSNASVGGTMSGPIRFDRTFYNLAFQLGRRANDYQSLVNTDAVGLRAAGVSADSAARLGAILGPMGVPSVIGRIPNSRESRQGSLFGAIDFSPRSSTAQSFNLTFNAGWNDQDPATGSATEMPSSSGQRSGYRGGVQGRHTSYLRGVILSETSVGVNASSNTSHPFLTMPGGRVRVSSTFDDGGDAVQMLSFGGNQYLNSRQTSSNVGATNQLSWFSRDNKHRLKLTTELRRDAFSQEQSSNVLGTFTFNSLADVANGQPASYSRQLAPSSAAAAALVGGASLGDSYRPRSNLQLQYGVRVDGTRFLDAPAANPLVEQTFGLTNAHAPSAVFVSPRAGFSWTYGRAAQISGFEGAARVPRAVIRGGAGMFQGTSAPTMLANALMNTGLANAARSLRCVGSATPVPNWGAYANDPSSVPASCADGSMGTVFADTAPNVTLVAPDYVAPRSVRSNLGWNGAVLGNRFMLSADVTWSLNLNQPGSVDLNFDPTARFTLANEGNRPVFVQPSSIVPQTGSVASRDARVSPAFAHVSEMRSDLTSQSRQLSLQLSPTRFSTGFSWGLSYVYSNVRDKQRGFGNTAGNPWDTDWSRSSMDSRHQFNYNLGYNILDAVRVNWYGSFRSGLPYTPVVGGDINGDGYSNDRAFVFDPASAPSAAVTDGMNALLSSGSASARRCLTSQVGKVAGRNSCEGPWSSNATLSISFNPAKIRMPQRASISLQLANPLAAADLALHGENSLRGWGQLTMPDPTLLYVRGFDPGTNRYSYDVNRRFGATSPTLTANRAPVALTAMLRIDVGPTRERQMLTQQLDRGRSHPGERIPEQVLRMMLASGGGLPNPMATILRQQDTLRLTGPQADSIATLNRRYVIRLDSIWSPLATYYAGLGNDYDHDLAADRYMAARRATVDMLADLGPRVKGLLTPEQRRKLPPFISSYLEPRYLASIRSGTATFAAGFSPMMMSSGGATMAGAGGGETHTIIIHR